MRRSGRLLAYGASVGVLTLLWVNAYFEFVGESPLTRMARVTVLTAFVLLLFRSSRRRAHERQDIDRDRARLAELIDNIPLATLAVGRDARIVTWNRAAEQLFGWTRTEVIGKTNPAIPSEDRQSSNELFGRIRGGERLHGVEAVRQARDGSRVEVSLYSAPLGADGSLVLYDDIGERKLAQTERDQAQRRYRELIESLPLVTYIDLVDDSATNIYTSPQVSDILGWSPDELHADPSHFEDILHPDDRERVMHEVRVANATREPFDSQYRLRHRDGTYVWVRDRSEVMEDEHGQPVARGFLLDITQQKELEEQLRQAQKMDALGQFAGGIAHDFNNLLTGIGGYAELAASKTERDTVVSRCLDGIRSAAEEASSLTSRLLAFSRRNVPERRLLDLNAIVQEAAALLERLVRADVHMTLALSQPLPAVAADRAQLKQVVLNLALNARDAMPNGGKLTIETAFVGENVILRVRDTGAGMDAATRSRALEPFFTTKPEGEGTGLGLALVYGVVDGLGGRLSIDSAIGLGTIVEIALPAADALADEPTVREVAPATHNAERVLVVEDREVVRDLARDVLEASGFDVIAVSGGREALDAVASGKPFDLLLTDVVMPEMSGPELAVQMRARKPGLPVLYMSGYTDDVLGVHDLSQEATAFLRKPFANSELIAAARKLLDGQPCASDALATAKSSALRPTH